MKRREFVKKSMIAASGIAVAPSLLVKKDGKDNLKLTILHTNDTHSQIDPFPANHSKYPNRGGVVWRYNEIQKVRAQEEHVLLVDSGDLFQGTPYFNKYKGILEMKLMSEMGYEASTMGNHEFDIALEGFKHAKQHATFPFICTNYDFSNTILAGETVKHLIINKGKLKIGLIGLGVEMEGLVPKNCYGDTKYLDPIAAANTEAELLKKKNCDLIICLSHLGFEYADSQKVSDRTLAKSSRNIDIILGGHTHTFLEKPIEEINLDGKKVMINQTGFAGINLGRIDIQFS